MSNYTIAVDWSGKDALSDSDSAKVISGADFNTEFTTVQTAVNTKADVNGSATESFSAATATAATNTTQVATTAYVQTELAGYPTSTGTGASGTWAIAISGNAATATSATTATTATTATNVTNAFGQGQSWADVKSTRALSTTYTNSTGKPIMVSIGMTSVNNVYGELTATISGVTLSLGYYTGNGQSGPASSFVVPDGDTYQIACSNGAIRAWAELR